MRGIMLLSSGNERSQAIGGLDPLVQASTPSGDQHCEFLRIKVATIYMALFFRVRSRH